MDLWLANTKSCIYILSSAILAKYGLSNCHKTSSRERVVADYQATGELLVELGSDQTSLHNPFGGGYYPVQLGFDEAQQVLKNDPPRFKQLVQERYIYP